MGCKTNSSLNILLFSRYGNLGASSRLRFYQYIPLLKQQDINVTVSSLYCDQYLMWLYANKKISKFYLLCRFFKRFFTLFHVFKYDAIWIEKELFPFLPAWCELVLNSLGVKYVVDYDDAIFHNYDLSSNKLVKRFLSNKIDVVMRNAHCVTAGNDYLADRARSAQARNIINIPTVVDHLRYYLTDNNSNAPLIIGWVGSPSTQQYVESINEILIAACLKHKAKLILVGASDDVAASFPEIDIEILPWTESTEASIIQQFSLGIMPLRDGPWEKGKCGYKLIQYMACGKPVIASNVGVNKQIVSRSNSGLTVNNDIEWQSALNDLLSNYSLRATLGENGRNAVINDYSIQSQISVLANIFVNVSNN